MSDEASTKTLATERRKAKMPWAGSPKGMGEVIERAHRLMEHHVQQEVATRERRIAELKARIAAEQAESSQDYLDVDTLEREIEALRRDYQPRIDIMSKDRTLEYRSYGYPSNTMHPSAVTEIAIRTEGARSWEPRIAIYFDRRHGGSVEVRGKDETWVESTLASLVDLIEERRHWTLIFNGKYGFWARSAVTGLVGVLLFLLVRQWLGGPVTADLPDLVVAFLVGLTASVGMGLVFHRFFPEFYLTAEGDKPSGAAAVSIFCGIAVAILTNVVSAVILSGS